MASSDQAGKRARLKRSGFGLPIFIHIGAKGSECAGRNAPVKPFPVLDVRDAQRVIRIAFQDRREVEDDQRQDHLLERKLVEREAVRIEVRGRVDMSAVLSHHRVEVARK